MRGVRRLGAHRGRGQSEGLTKCAYQAIMETACEPRQLATRIERVDDAQRRGMLDRVIVALLWMGLMRRSEVSAVTWQDVQFVEDSDYAYVRIQKSKNNQFGDREDVRTLKGSAAEALRDLRRMRSHEPVSARVVPLSGFCVNIRFQNCCKSIGLEGLFTSHSGRIGMASTLCGAGAPLQAVAVAGGWTSPEMVVHYSRRVSLEDGAIAKFL